MAQGLRERGVHTLQGAATQDVCVLSWSARVHPLDCRSRAAVMLDHAMQAGRHLSWSPLTGGIASVLL